MLIEISLLFENLVSKSAVVLGSYERHNDRYDGGYSPKNKTRLTKKGVAHAGL